MTKPLHRLKSCILAGTLLVAGTAAAVPPEAPRPLPAGHNCGSCHSLNAREAADLIRPLKLAVKTVRHSPVAGLFEIVAERDGREGIVYVDYGKKLLMQGVIVDAAQLRSAMPPEAQAAP